MRFDSRESNGVGSSRDITILNAGTGAVIHFANNSWINPPGAATGNLGNNGPHGLSEILYAYSSATGNNGSAFGGITSNTPWYGTT